MLDSIKFVLGVACAIVLFGWVFDSIKNITYIYTSKKGKKRR